VKLWSQVAGEVLVFDGKKTRRFAESLVSSGASDDRRSAKVLVEMLDSPAHRETANQQLPPELRGIMLTLSGRKSATQAVCRVLKLWREPIQKLWRVAPAFD
jgi:hypothetical protein